MEWTGKAFAFYNLHLQFIQLTLQFFPGHEIPRY